MSVRYECTRCCSSFPNRREAINHKCKGLIEGESASLPEIPMSEVPKLIKHIEAHLELCKQMDAYGVTAKLLDQALNELKKLPPPHGLPISAPASI